MTTILERFGYKIESAILYTDYTKAALKITCSEAEEILTHCLRAVYKLSGNIYRIENYQYVSRRKISNSQQRSSSLSVHGWYSHQMNLPSVIKWLIYFQHWWRVSNSIPPSCSPTIYPRHHGAPQCTSLGWVNLARGWLIYSPKRQPWTVMNCDELSTASTDELGTFMYK